VPPVPSSEFPVRNPRLYDPDDTLGLMLGGGGARGAYQAGVLRAMTEAGLKIDVLAGHGPGVMTSLAGAIDGGGRLWDASGPWASPRLAHAYRWRPALRIAGWGLVAAGAVLLSPLLVLALAALMYGASLVAGLVHAPGASQWLIDVYGRAMAVLFQPPIIPSIVPGVLVLVLLVVLGVLAGTAVSAWRREPSRRRLAGAFWWRLVGSPLEGDEPADAWVEMLWQLVRGASNGPTPAPADIGRRYVEILSENLGQPGFRELLIGVHDLDARRDVVGAVLAGEPKASFDRRRKGPGPREAEVIDLTGPTREVLVDLLVGAQRLPVATAPHTLSFPADSYWRGEAHRISDRPELAVRLIDEVAAIGVEQVILVGAAPPPAAPHAMRARPIDLGGRIGELVRSMESAAFEDAWSSAATRFSGVFVIRPDHNPIGPFDFSGVYDESSDRRRSVSELLQQGHEDAYRQFIDPVVAAGDRIQEF
jgi:hypothetical protein